MIWDFRFWDAFMPLLIRSSFCPCLQKVLHFLSCQALPASPCFRWESACSACCFAMAENCSSWFLWEGIYCSGWLLLPAFFPWLVRFSLTFAEDLHLPLKLWYLADALIDLGIGHLGPFRCKLCMSMRFQKISGESTTGRKSTCFFRKVEIQLLRYGDLQHNSKCPNLEFAPLNGIKFVTKGSKYMGESCCSYWFCSQSYYVLGTSIR